MPWAHDPSITVLEGQPVQLDPLAGIPTDWVASSYWKVPGFGLSGTGPVAIDQLHQPDVLVIAVEDKWGCWHTQQIDLLVEKMARTIFVPTAFSPNADGRNDILQVHPPHDRFLDDVNWSVYDRWGNAVIQGQHQRIDQPTDLWDGTWRGQPAPLGVYVLQIGWQTPDGLIRKRQYDVTVLR